MLIFFSLSVLLHVFLLVNTKFTLWPEMVVYPYLINKGFILYKDIINPYQPLLAYTLAIFSKLFGYEPSSFRILTISIILLIDLLVFVLTFKITRSKIAALASTLFFVVFSIPFGANGLWFDLVQTPFILLAVFSFKNFLKVEKSKYFFWTFFFLTLAFFIKQQAVWLLLWVFVFLIFKYKQKTIKLISQNLAAFLPAIFLLANFFVLFIKKGILTDYLYWTFFFPFFKSSSLPGYILLPSKRQLLIVFLLCLFFLPYLLRRKKAAFIIGSFFSLLLFAYPRFDYLHLIPALSIASLIFVPTVSFIFQKKFFIPISSLVLILLSIFSMRFYLRNWSKETRFFEKDIYLATANLKSLQRYFSGSIYIQNGPDQIYPLSQTVPSKPWATQFPWYMELGTTQQEMVNGIEKEKVKFILSQPYSSGKKYDLGAYKPDFFAEFVENNYQREIPISESLFLRINNENR